MLRSDPIVSRYPEFLPTEEEVSLALELLQRPEHKELREALADRICIGGCPASAVLRFSWQARQEKRFGPDCAQGAIEWLARCVASRAKLGVDGLLGDGGPFSAKFQELYVAALPFSVHRTDRQGHPVLITRYCSKDLEAFRALWAEGEALQQRLGLAVNAVVLFHIRNMEYITKVVMAEETKRQGRIVDRMLAIMDMTGVGLKHLNSPLKAFMAGVSKESVPLFPETLHATVLANVPWVVSRAAWPVAKSFLHPVTQDKFCILSSAAELKAKLEELIAPEDVPPYFGGSCSCAECLGGALRGGSLFTWEAARSAAPTSPKPPRKETPLGGGDGAAPS